MIEPNVDLLWDIYLDWLADQGYDDLRFIPIESLTSGSDRIINSHRKLDQNYLQVAIDASNSLINFIDAESFGDFSICCEFLDNNFEFIRLYHSGENEVLHESDYDFGVGSTRGSGSFQYRFTGNNS